jgi:RNase P/RNase MRP subunit POP5
MLCRTLEPEQSTIARDTFTRALNESLLQLFGLAGGAIALDFIKYDPAERTGIIKVDIG